MDEDKKLFEYYIDLYKTSSDDTDLEELENQTKRVKNLIENLTEKYIEFKDFPYELLETKEKAKLLNFLLNITQERQIVSNIRKDNVDRNFANFLFKDDEAERTTSMFLKDHPDYIPLDLSLARTNNRQMIRIALSPIQNVLQELNKQNEKIVRVIIDEVNLFKVIGFSYSNLDYLKDYIDYVSDGVLQFLVHRVIFNTNVNDKEKIFNNLSDKLDTLLILINKQLKRKRTEQQKQNRLTANVLTEYFTTYRTHYSRYNEELNILSILTNEIKEDIELFGPLQEKFRAEKVPLSEEEIERSRNIITEGHSIEEYKRKLEETRKIIAIMGTAGGRNCYSNCLQDIKVYFREIYRSKAEYNDRQTMRIIRRYLKQTEIKGVQPFEKTSQYMFFREKISRGYFREMGLIDLYVAKASIHEKLYNLLLKTYLFYDFLDSIEYIYEINHQIIQALKSEADRSFG